MKNLLREFLPKHEQKECGGRVPSLAARFAAKEATAKALGSGIGDVSWLDIEIRGDENNAPHLYLYGMGKEGEEIGVVKLVCEFDSYRKSGNGICSSDQ